MPGSATTENKATFTGNPGSSCRYDTSLGLLTKRFINLIETADEGTLDLNKGTCDASYTHTPTMHSHVSVHSRTRVTCCSATFLVCTGMRSSCWINAPLSSNTVTTHTSVSTGGGKGKPMRSQRNAHTHMCRSFSCACISVPFVGFNARYSCGRAACTETAHLRYHKCARGDRAH